MSVGLCERSLTREEGSRTSQGSVCFGGSQISRGSRKDRCLCSLELLVSFLCLLAYILFEQVIPFWKVLAGTHLQQRTVPDAAPAPGRAPSAWLLSQPCSSQLRVLPQSGERGGATSRGHPRGPAPSGLQQRRGARGAGAVSPAVRSRRSRQRFPSARKAAERCRAHGASVHSRSAGPGTAWTGCRRARDVGRAAAPDLQPPVLPEAFTTATRRLVMELKKTTSRVCSAALLLPLSLLFWGKFLSSLPDSYPGNMRSL